MKALPYGAGLACALFALAACQDNSQTSSEPAEQSQADAAPAAAPAEPDVTQTTVDEPVVEEPAVEEPVVEEPAADAGMPEAPAGPEAPETDPADAAPEAADAEAGDAGTQVASAAVGSAERGEQVFRVCMACHVVQEGMHRVGPSLYNVVGRAAASAEGFNRYSAGMRNSGIVWTEETLDPYLENPRAVVPGGSMAFAGLQNPQQRADVIAYLRANSPDAPPL